MNHTYNVIILLLIIAFLSYILFLWKKIRKLSDLNVALQIAGAKFVQEHRILVDQYRQLANINKAFRDVSKVRNYKKK
jgi:uncharacterized protein YdeI (YjbR/CyaY-like superfamily)